MASSQRDVERRSFLSVLYRFTFRMAVGVLGSFFLVAWICTATGDRALGVEVLQTNGSFGAGVDSHGWHVAQITGGLLFAAAPWTFETNHGDGFFYDADPMETPIARSDHAGVSHREFWRLTGTENVYSVNHWTLAGLFVLSFLGLFALWNLFRPHPGHSAEKPATRRTDTDPSGPPNTT